MPKQANHKILREIEKETLDAENQVFRQTVDEIKRRGLKVNQDEISEFMATTKQKVYKRPMTAVNRWKKKQPTATHVYEKLSEGSDFDREFEEVKVDHTFL